MKNRKENLFVASIGGLLLGMISAQVLITGLGVILLISAVKTFQHAH